MIEPVQTFQAEGACGINPTRIGDYMMISVGVNLILVIGIGNKEDLKKYSRECTANSFRMPCKNVIHLSSSLMVKHAKS